MKIEINPGNLTDPYATRHAATAANGLLAAFLSFSTETQRHINLGIVWIEPGGEGEEIPWRIKLQIVFHSSEMKTLTWEISEYYYCTLDDQLRTQMEKEVTKVTACLVTRRLENSKVGELATT